MDEMSSSDVKSGISLCKISYEPITVGQCGHQMFFNSKNGDLSDPFREYQVLSLAVKTEYIFKNKKIYLIDPYTCNFWTEIGCNWVSLRR